MKAGELGIVDSAVDEAVLFKPAGLSSERGPGDRGDSVVTRVPSMLGWSACHLPHRLDRPTRGLMVVAASSDAAARLSEEIRRGAWTKWYYARIEAAEGVPAGLLGEHRCYLKREGRVARVVRAGGDPSRLTVIAVSRCRDAPAQSMALVRLDTGRFHQIRAMLAHIGFPLVGDTDYGGRARRKLDYPDIDLEACALRIERPDGTRVHRMPGHPDRTGVPIDLERMLDEVSGFDPGRRG